MICTWQTILFIHIYHQIITKDISNICIPGRPCPEYPRQRLGCPAVPASPPRASHDGRQRHRDLRSPLALHKSHPRLGEWGAIYSCSSSRSKYIWLFNFIVEKYTFPPFLSFFSASKYLAATCKQAHAARKGRGPVRQETPRLCDQHGLGEISSWSTSDFCAFIIFE